MRIRRLNHVAVLAGAAVLLMAARAGATTIISSTDAAGTGFGGSSLTLNNILGEAARLTFITDANITTGTPSNVNTGNFTLACPTCSAQAGGGSVFDAITIDLSLTDLTDAATGRFTGSSTGIAVHSVPSQVTIQLAPPQLEPGATNALS